MSKASDWARLVTTTGGRDLPAEGRCGLSILRGFFNFWSRLTPGDFLVRNWLEKYGKSMDKEEKATTVML